MTPESSLDIYWMYWDSWKVALDTKKNLSLKKKVQYSLPPHIENSL